MGAETFHAGEVPYWASHFQFIWTLTLIEKRDVLFKILSKTLCTTEVKLTGR